MTDTNAARLEELHRAHGDKMLLFAAKRSRNLDEAHDLTMEALLRICPFLDAIAPECAPAYWRRSILNLIITAHRRRAVAQFLSLDEMISEEEGLPAVQFPAPLRPIHYSVESQMESMAVRRAVAQLSPDHRVVVLLFYFQGREVAQIGEILGIPTNTVKSRLARARLSLERKLRSSQVEN